MGNVIRSRPRACDICTTSASFERFSNRIASSLLPRIFSDNDREDSASRPRKIVSIGCGTDATQDRDLRARKNVGFASRYDAAFVCERIGAHSACEGPLPNALGANRRRVDFAQLQRSFMLTFFGRFAFASTDTLCHLFSLIYACARNDPLPAKCRFCLFLLQNDVE